MRPVALTIAGSDSGGEAGLQADLKTFTRVGVHGATVVSCLTAQNRQAVTRIEPVSPAMVRAQLEAVFAGPRPRAAKTGMLWSAEIVREVARFFRRHPEVPLVVDPVITATSGRRLLTAEGSASLRRDLLPLATLVTPNRMEAETLTGKTIRSAEDARAAARWLHGKFGCAALVKGGHLATARESVDFLFDGEQEWLLSAPRVRGVRLHGTGCVYSAAITAWLARGKPLAVAVRLAKQLITNAICENKKASG